MSANSTSNVSRRDAEQPRAGAGHDDLSAIAPGSIPELVRRQMGLLEAAWAAERNDVALRALPSLPDLPAIQRWAIRAPRGADQEHRAGALLVAIEERGTSWAHGRGLGSGTLPELPRDLLSRVNDLTSSSMVGMDDRTLRKRGEVRIDDVPSRGSPVEQRKGSDADWREQTTEIDPAMAVEFSEELPLPSGPLTPAGIEERHEAWRLEIAGEIARVAETPIERRIAESALFLVGFGLRNARKARIAGVPVRTLDYALSRLLQRVAESRPDLLGTIAQVRLSD